MNEAKLCYRVAGGDLGRAGDASVSMMTALKEMGLPPGLIRRAAVCMYEGEINMVLHARGGDAEVLVDSSAVTIRLTDTGPGIANVAKAMEEGYSTADETARDMGFGAGMGLPNMARHSDEITVDSVIGGGTVVTMKLYIPAGADASQC